MLTDPLSRKRRRAAQSSALVIVLFFVVLLSVVTIAFLSRSLVAIQVSSGSAGETRSKILASSASDIIIGDLKQEIIAGSSSVGAANWPVYTPTSNQCMIPWQNGVPLLGSPTTNAIPNLISRSVSPSNTSGSAPYVTYPSTLYTSTAVPPNRAASDATAASPTLSTNAPYTTSKVNSSYPSLNGRYISPAQWNSHYLIPRNSAVDSLGSTNTDSTPMTNFVSPDWIVVTRGGATNVSWVSGSGGLNDATMTNNNYAVGRYAYAVYNEGGLLDMNAAGYPADTNGATATTPPFNTQGPNGLTSAQISEKGSLALADLTQLVSGWTTPTPAQAQGQINNLVGWRNYATAGLSSANGYFGSYLIYSTNATSWLTNFARSNANGFTQIVSASGATPSDQAILSRQQLISLSQSLSLSPDILQYLGTFSRGLEQPSTVPDPNRPKILSNGLAPPTAGGSPNESTYIGNNDGQGGDTDPSGINPSFLSIRVGSTFTRINGATAVLGEPLVKTKFPLSWLSMVTYNYANVFGTTSNTPAQNAILAANDPVYQRFGIFKTSISSPWTYYHGQNSIMTLSQVAAAGREPDFAELLKAAIIAGSLAKAGPNILIGGNNYQYTLDSSLDLNVLQVMANLIDQQDTDSYPTVIQISTGSYYRTVYGVEDLPYFYRYHLMSVVDTLPTGTILSNTNSVTFPVPIGTNVTTGSITSALDYTSTSATPTAKSWTVSNIAPATVNGMAPGTVSAAAAGEATMLIVPDLWNPHDQNTTASETSSLRPSQYRIYAVTTDPANLTTTWNIGAEASLSGSARFPYAPATPTNDTYTAIMPENDGTPQYYYWPISDPQPYNAPTAYNTTGNNIMYFADGGGTLFREPTLLWNTNPTGISPSITGVSSMGPSVIDANTSKTFFGMIAGKAPVQMQVNFTTKPTARTGQGGDGNYIVQATTLNLLYYKPASSYKQITFFLQYLDPNTANNWITYDAKYPEVSYGINTANLVVNTTKDYTNYNNILKTGQFAYNSTSMDPRTGRWGMVANSQLGSVSPGTWGSQNPSSNTSYLLETTANSTYNSATLGTFSVLETDRPRADKANLVLYATPCAVSQNGTPGPNNQMHWFSGTTYYASAGSPGYASPFDFMGLFTQNNPALLFNSKGGPSVAATAGQQNYVEDADGMVRLAMGGYNTDTAMTDSSTSSLAQTPSSDPSRIGLPEATASTVSDNAVATATAQTQSRPMILNRPFRSVSEMSYAFQGTPWKNIDFFTPASGDSALLDTFCLTQPPASAMVAGKVDLNTRQIPVLQALVAGAYRDEFNNVSSPPSYALPPLSGAEANNVATKLVGITSDTTHAWRGPLKNISGLVGRFVASPGSTTGYSDFYTYAPASPANGQPASMTYAGLSAALDSTVYTNSTNSASASAPYIQRFREAGLRPLVDAGQVRVWNLLIDVVAQTGRYPKSATGFDQFVVNGQTRLWVHVAIDRYTGQVIDKQVEVVTP